MSTQVASAMPPPAARPAAGLKRKREVTTLDEDEWTSRIEAIIQRDYYPDLPKLQNKLEWLQAVRSGDSMQIQQAQLNIAQRRAGIKTPVGATPAAFGTPGASLLRTSGLGTPAFGTPAMTPGLQVTAGGQVIPAGPQDPTLDKFFALHNSEDNKSFNELMQISRARLRKAKPWLFKDHNPPQQPAGLLTGSHAQQPLLRTAQTSASTGSDQDNATAASVSGQLAVHPNTTALQASSSSQGQAGAIATAPTADTAANRPASDTDGFGTTGQPSSTLISWPHTNKSALYYDSSQRDVVPWTEDELADMVQGPPKQIKHSATRFPSDFDSSQDQASGSGQLGSDAQQPGAVRGYGVLNTPAFTPGPDQSPLMTWGDIGSTPVRLDEEDDIHVSASSGSAFKMADVPVREQLGRGAAQKATLSLRRKSAARQGNPLAGLSAAGLTPGKGKAPGTPLSAAGKRLLSNLRGGTPSGNAQLRASYKTQTPGRFSAVSSPAPSGWGTPVLEKTPKPSLARKAPLSTVTRMNAPDVAAAAAGPGTKTQVSANLTDDLLKL